MKIKTKIFSLLLVLLFFGLQLTTFAQSKTLNDPKMQWWKDARFGMFIHWGLYAVPAGVWNGQEVKPGYGEWIMNKAKIPMADYQKLPAQFNPIQFNADEWVKTAKDAGMKYIVITSKHHDGFAMFKSSDPFNIVDATPFKRDPIKELADACKKYDIKFGLYYSQAQDWNHPGGAASGGHWDKAQDGSMDKYIDEVAVPQVREILSAYNPAIIWWDTPTDMNTERATKIANELKAYPNLITNNRLGGGFEGDLETPEQYIPATGIPGKNWESCITMNGTWGFKINDNNWKSTQVLVRNLIDIASKGGNYLLNVGPTAEGIIPIPSVERLQQMGKWLKVNGESIYGTTASPFAYLSWGRATVKGNKIYLHVFDYPKDGKIKVPLANTILKAYLLSNPANIIKTTKNGIYTYLDLPKTAADKIATVIVLEIKGEAKTSITEPIPSIGKQGAASSTFADVNNKYNAKNAFDNDSKTSWKAAKTDSTATLNIVFDQATSIGAVALTEAGKRCQKFVIEYKDGDSWKQIIEGKNIGNGIFRKFEPVKAKEFRLNVLQSSPVGIEIKEFQLFYDE